MKCALTFGIVAVCFAAPVSYVIAGSRETPRVEAGEFVAGYVNLYSAAPRIIHVPDADERASVRDWPDDEDADLRKPNAPLRVAPPHRQHRAVKNANAHRTSERKRTAHRRPYSASARAVPPPAPADHRSILSAPPPPLDGPTPIRPTPRFAQPVPKPQTTNQHAEAPVSTAVPPEAEEQAAEPVSQPIRSGGPATERPESAGR